MALDACLKIRMMEGVRQQCDETPDSVPKWVALTVAQAL